MDVSRNFMVVGSLFLVIGITLGMYMGGSGDHTLAPVHAHINLLGFVLMTIFGLIYRAFPIMAASRLATLHFWLHTVGAVILLILLFLLMSGRITEAAMAPAAPISEGLVMLGVLTYVYNLFTNGQ